MAIYRLPPSPFVGGRQPLAPKDLNPSFEDNPPVVNDPPGRKWGVLAAIFIAWQPVSIPVQQQRFVPIVEEQQQVPIVRHPEIYSNWTTDYLIPQLPKKYVPEEAVVSDVVPYARNVIAISNWQDRLQFIQLPAKIAPQVPEVVADFVPNVKPNLYIFSTYIPPQIPRKSAAIIPVAPVNDPPFGQRIWLNTILHAWTPETPRSISSPKYIPEPEVVDDPPFGRRVLWLNTVLDAWIPPPPPPWNPIDHITPPTSNDIIIWLWKRVS